MSNEEYLEFLEIRLYVLECILDDDYNVYSLRNELEDEKVLKFYNYFKNEEKSLVEIMFKSLNAEYDRVVREEYED